MCVTGRRQVGFWRLMTAPRPLMTPSILSLANHADYPQRHLLTLYANETESGSNEKRVTDEKEEELKGRVYSMKGYMGDAEIEPKALNACSGEGNSKQT